MDMVCFQVKFDMLAADEAVQHVYTLDIWCERHCLVSGGPVTHVEQIKLFVLHDTNCLALSHHTESAESEQIC